MSRKEKWLVSGVVVVLLCLLSWLVLDIRQEMALSVPVGHSPSEGEAVRVTYTIPAANGEWVQLKWSIAGYVERIRFEEMTGFPIHGFVDLKILTTEGWYESPRCSLAGPVDWEKGVTVHFEYPEGMKLREQTAGFGGPVDQILGIDTGEGGGMGCPPIDGDIASIRLQRGEDGRGYSFKVVRTTGLHNAGYAGTYDRFQVFEFFFANTREEIPR